MNEDNNTEEMFTELDEVLTYTKEEIEQLELDFKRSSNRNNT